MRWSNTGFKYKLAIDVSGLLVSLPYRNAFTDASSVWQDLVEPGELDQYIDGVGGYKAYLGFHNPPTSENYTLLPGIALFVVAVDPTWMICGSHDPVFSYTLWVGENYVSIPCNIKATKAHDLFDTIPNCGSVAYYDAVNGVFLTWTGSSGDDFDIVRGEAVSIVVDTATAWKPEVY